MKTKVRIKYWNSKNEGYIEGFISDSSGIPKVIVSVNNELICKQLDDVKVIGQYHEQI